MDKVRLCADSRLSGSLSRCTSFSGAFSVWKHTGASVTKSMLSTVSRGRESERLWVACVARSSRQDSF